MVVTEQLPGRRESPLFRQGEHRRGRIDADDEIIRFPGQRRRQHAGAAAKIEYCAALLRQITAKVEILGPAILNVVKIKLHPDRGPYHFIDLMRTGVGWYRGRAHPTK
jgi:hypothetical protein